MKFKLLITAAALVALAGTATAQVKPEDAIKWRQSGYAFMAWNMTRIKMNVEGAAYNKDEVIKAANAIQAVANSGMGALYLPGTDTGTGWEKTRVKPELWTNKETLGKVATAFGKEANEMAKVAAAGDAAATKEQFGKLAATCKGCHDEFKIKQ
ncbi:c-type cytochrome [Paramagnetospirillum magneticum]|uniref:Cytochrome c n=1 Tax=Paramagnetospirillum magneticum (strain ATCC 700264 / AMB-1) TaxID=342108 RepID=Q2W9C0_PARM1|nr:cytochrome c [Paramagnetospirillum magneticum]BAE49555.1 Cytochrome c' precursor [Paramagnetospirillum magneticum AMB-1]